ncbi:MAG: hypothetical protein IKR74_05145 [Bacilli bacterium]|nr:hypothetical protein [Bacilli bacterium]
MRDAVGGAWVYGMVMVFTLLFSAFLALALTYARAYRLKNEMTAIIEKYQGITIDDSLSGLGSVSIINNYLKNNGHDTKGHCPEGSYGVTDLDSEALELTNSSKKYRYCISYEKNTFKNCTYIFKIRVFYDFNLPLLGRVRKFNVNGQTNELNIAYMNGKLLPC